MENKFEKIEQKPTQDVESESEEKKLWEEFFEEGRHIRDELMKKIRAQLGVDATMDFYNECAEFGKEIEAHFPDFREYAAHHILGYSSGIKYEEAPKKDFPAPYSVMEFYRKKQEELKEEK